jgi:hypothetical protein
VGYAVAGDIGSRLPALKHGPVKVSRKGGVSKKRKAGMDNM